jgi:hypothetical protein
MLLILLECCTINVWAEDISWKVISLQLKGYTSMEWQFHVAQFLLHSQFHNLLSTYSMDPLPSVMTPKDNTHVLPPTRKCRKTL